MRYAYLNILFLLLFLSCDYFTIKEESKHAVARVNETYLFREDLKNIVSSGTSSQDSILITTNYINNWVEQQLLLSKAQLNLENKADKTRFCARAFPQRRDPGDVLAAKEGIEVPTAKPLALESDRFWWNHQNRESASIL